MAVCLMPASVVNEMQIRTTNVTAHKIHLDKDKSFKEDPTF